VVVDGEGIGVAGEPMEEISDVVVLAPAVTGEPREEETPVPREE
jgi:hypothetical protein